MSELVSLLLPLMILKRSKVLPLPGFQVSLQSIPLLYGLNNSQPPRKVMFQRHTMRLEEQ